MKKLLLILTLPLLMGAGCTANNDNKYQACMDACCKRGTYSESSGMCSTPNVILGSSPDQECKNICVEKYK